jgi:hypothetical protein
VAQALGSESTSISTIFELTTPGRRLAAPLWVAVREHAAPFLASFAAMQSIVDDLAAQDAVRLVLKGRFERLAEGRPVPMTGRPMAAALPRFCCFISRGSLCRPFPACLGKRRLGMAPSLFCFRKKRANYLLQM